MPHECAAKARARPKIGPLAGFIDGILEADRRAPRKQRHTAHRIWVRITKERPEVTIVESTARRYVRERKRALGLRTNPEVFVPQQYAWGEAAQVDWHEAAVDLDGERQTMQVFAMRSMASGAPFHRSYPRATQQAFLEAHELGLCGQARRGLHGYSGDGQAGPCAVQHGLRSRWGSHQSVAYLDADGYAHAPARGLRAGSQDFLIVSSPPGP